MSKTSARHSGCPPRPRQAHSPPPFALGSITELPEYASQSSGFQQAAFEPGLSVWETGSSSENARVDEALYMSTSINARLFGRPSELRSSCVQWKRLMPKPFVVKKWSIDRDCGICFEIAVNPRRTRCCGNIFCSEHLTDWLGGDAIAGSCPSCQMRCSIDANTISLASPSKPTMSRPYGHPRATPSETDQSNLRHPRSYTNPPSSESSLPLSSSHLRNRPYMSSSESASHTLVTADARPGSPHCAPSRPNTPCSAFAHDDNTDSPEFRTTSFDHGAPAPSSSGSFAVTSKDTGDLLILAILAACIYAVLS